MPRMLAGQPKPAYVAGMVAAAFVAPGAKSIRAIAPTALRVLGLRTGLTHLEWFRRPDGSIAVSEVAVRAVTLGRISQPIERRYNTASIFKRARGAGRITRCEGIDELLAEFGAHVAAVDLLPVGAQRRDWRATSLSDGVVVVRHRELAKTIEMADRFAADLHLYAG